MSIHIQKLDYYYSACRYILLGITGKSQGFCTGQSSIVATLSLVCRTTNRSTSLFFNQLGDRFPVISLNVCKMTNLLKKEDQTTLNHFQSNQRCFTCLIKLCIVSHCLSLAQSSCNEHDVHIHVDSKLQIISS